MDRQISKKTIACRPIPMGTSAVAVRGGRSLHGGLPYTKALGIAGPELAATVGPADRLDARSVHSDDIASRVAESRMEDEGAPPLPSDDQESSPTTETQLRGRHRRRPVRATGSAKVSDAMTRSVCSVTGDTSVRDIALLMASEAIGAMPVVGPGNHLLGMIADRDIVIRVCAGDKGIEDLRATDVMIGDPVGIAADKSVADALDLMARVQVHRLPVVDEEFRLIGMLSTGDIASRPESSAELREALAKISDRRAFWTRIWR